MSNDDAYRQHASGEFVRPQSAFREWVSPEASAKYRAQAGRYHLYVSNACPWAHRAILVRAIKGLESVISMSTVAPETGGNGWSFVEFQGGDPDPVFQAAHLHEIYSRVRSDYTGRATVPVLLDKHTGEIVNNESSEIIRIMNDSFNAFSPYPDTNLYPEHLRTRIDEVNEWVYATINNGVYRAGFATSQEKYEEAVSALFLSLDRIEQLLETQDFLCGHALTEADLRLFPTLIRFDCVYYFHFKCNIRRIADYPRLADYVKRLFELPGVGRTVNFKHIRNHYFRSHTKLNPSRIIPMGPDLAAFSYAS
ncbi:glutathione S-transferase family protein [Paraburkholderia oxyphila]|uniref:glutathione S-transferase family protein n=1 Tax=Paraburkholderia oxyphila TaxID=614212 RepID=UPI002ADD5652|nr:glutathione S-transferase family protein [Paraburkholderia oxyphila]